MGQEIRTAYPEQHTCAECDTKFNCRSCHLPQNLVNKFENCIKIKNPFHNQNFAELHHVDCSQEFLHFCKEECVAEFYHYVLVVRIVLEIFKESDETYNDSNETSENTLILPWARQ